MPRRCCFRRCCSTSSTPSRRGHSSPIAAGLCRTRHPRRVAVRRGRFEACKAGGRAARRAVVISAVPWFAFAEALDDAARADASATSSLIAEKMESSPIVTVNLWFDRAVLDDACSACRGAPFNGCSASGALSAARCRTCRWCRAAPRRLWRSTTKRSPPRRLRELSRRSCRARRGCPPRLDCARTARDVLVAPSVPPRPSGTTPVSTACSWPATGLRPDCPLRLRALSSRATPPPERPFRCRGPRAIGHRALPGDRAQGKEPPVVPPSARAQSA